jgi:hypothetical protein
MMWGNGLSRPALIAGAALVLLTLLTLGGLVEARRWARGLEAGRIAAVAVALIWYAAV